MDPISSNPLQKSLEEKKDIMKSTRSLQHVPREIARAHSTLSIGKATLMQTIHGFQLENSPMPKNYLQNSMPVLTLKRGYVYEPCRRKEILKRGYCREQYSRPPVSATNP